MSRRLDALLVDPALFTAPYDLALTEGLGEAGVGVRWACRKPRVGEGSWPDAQSEFIYYKGLETSAKAGGAMLKARKALSHLQGDRRLLSLVGRGGFDVVHFQWLVVPVVDSLVVRRIARRRPVVVTVHDLAPFNDSPTSRLQLLGFHRALAAASRLIVHTESARQTLIAQGRDPDRVVTIPHGPLTLSAPTIDAAPRASDGRWRIVLFGKLQAYKGADLLVEALGLLPTDVRARLEVIVAGEPFIEMGPLLHRVQALDLQDVVTFRPQRLDDGEVAALLASADSFVFPYRHIEASGVLHLVLPMQRWIIASDLGAFRDFVLNDVNGSRVPVGDARGLADAIAASIGRRPDPDRAVQAPGWDEIGRRTREVYDAAIASRGAR